jgi:hypothetical protein
MPIGGSGGREQLVNGGFEGDSCASRLHFSSVLRVSVQGSVNLCPAPELLFIYIQ